MARILVALIALTCGAAYADEAREVVERYDSAIVAQQWELAMQQVRPADVANLRALVLQQLSHPYSTDRQVCFGDASLEDIGKMSDATVGSCIFKAVLARAGHSVKHTLTVIGPVTENPDTVHFVVRGIITLAGQTTSRLDVVTVVREAGSWRVKLPQNLTAPAGSVTTASAPP